MKNLQLYQFLRIQFIRIKSSIAFYPALIALGFLVLSYFLMHFEQMELGQWIKEQWDFLDMRDASTARAITGTVAAGVLSLTVFSFSMVMIVLNQAAGNLSNRLLDLMINNRFQQFILGFYIGTIVYSLYILSTISEADEHVPGITIFLLIILTIFDIFLFIYFLHYITQSVKFDTNIQKIYRETQRALESHFPQEEPGRAEENAAPEKEGYILRSPTSGYFQEFQRKSLIKMSKEQGWLLEILILPGTFILKDSPVIAIYGDNTIKEEEAKEIFTYIDFYDKQDISKVPYWGFRQLMEVAIKALSPGINDPVTAVRSLNAMAQLLQYRILHFSDQEYRDDEGNLRIVYHERSAESIAENCLLPIWDYGKEDRIVVDAITWTIKPIADIAPGKNNIFYRLYETALEKKKEMGFD